MNQNLLYLHGKIRLVTIKNSIKKRQVANTNQLTHNYTALVIILRSEEKPRNNFFESSQWKN